MEMPTEEARSNAHIMLVITDDSEGKFLIKDCTDGALVSTMDHDGDRAWNVYLTKEELIKAGMVFLSIARGLD